MERATAINTQGGCDEVVGPCPAAEGAAAALPPATRPLTAPCSFAHVLGRRTGNRPFIALPCQHTAPCTSSHAPLTHKTHHTHRSTHAHLRVGLPQVGRSGGLAAGAAPGRLHHVCCTLHASLRVLHVRARSHMTARAQTAAHAVRTHSHTHTNERAHVQQHMPCARSLAGLASGATPHVATHAQGHT